MDDLEQYQRSNCLILHRSDIANNKNYNEFLKELVNILNIKLKLPSTDVIQKQDIDIVHCLPASNRSRQDRGGTKFIPPIIIKFVCCSLQNYIYSSKSKFVGSGLFITESLTRKRLHFLKVAQQEFQVQNTWSLKGSIFMHIKGEKTMIKTMNDINDILDNFNK